MPELTFEAVPGRVRAYAAEPAGRPPWPGVVVIHEALGLNDDIRAKADRFAARGYVALAPDLFSIGRKPVCVMSAMRALFKGAGPAVDVLDAARAELAGRRRLQRQGRRHRLLHGRRLRAAGRAAPRLRRQRRQLRPAAARRRRLLPRRLPRRRLLRRRGPHAQGRRRQARGGAERQRRRARRQGVPRRLALLPRPPTTARSACSRG